MAVDRLNHRISFIAAFFVFVDVIFGVVALTITYWTVEIFVTPGTAVNTPNGTILTHKNVDWTWNVSLIFLSAGGIFIWWDIFQITDQRFVIPFFLFVACVSLTAGLFDYGT
ncbi:unnamed protein product [Rotaria sp. Silwood2]|nr:unnamed protein product [Rotaria sp. Silwood2]